MRVVLRRSPLHAVWSAVEALLPTPDDLYLLRSVTACVSGTSIPSREPWIWLVTGRAWVDIEAHPRLRSVRHHVACSTPT